MKRVGIKPEEIYTDKQSGKDFARSRYQELLRKLDNQSILYVKSIDRLGRDYNEIIEQWRRITKDIGAYIVVLDMPLLDTRRSKDLLGTFLSDIVLQVLSFVAENERDNIRQRQKEGIYAAKQKGVQFGRPSFPLPDDFGQIYEMWERKEITAETAARQCKMSKSTFYRETKQWKENIGKCTF